MFRRKIEKQIKENFEDKNSKILVIDGARQIGKSFIIREIASSMFKHYVEIDLKSDFESEKVFESVNTTKSFYLAISALYGSSINDFNDTIIFLDEIQFYPKLLTLLKDLKKEGKFRYVASGSLLGVTLRHSFIPMGSINEIEMFPMDFEEFLWANGVSIDVIDYLRDCFKNRTIVDEAVHKHIFSLFKDYLISGGLPDAVKEYVINKNVFKTREVQNEIHNFYKDDCSKYDENKKLKISRIYEMIISYMSNKVKRIKFNKIENKDDFESNKYDEEFDYLTASGITNEAHAISDPVFPVNQSLAKNLIKLYYNDVGILTNLLYKNNINAILSNDVGINLGSVYETVCAMELRAHGHKLYYFDSKKVGEVDFLINDYDNLSVLPIEIKSGKDQYNFRAIPKLVKKDGNYKLPLGYVFGNKNICEFKNNLLILPVYLIMFI